MAAYTAKGIGETSEKDILSLSRNLCCIEIFLNGITRLIEAKKRLANSIEELFEKLSRLT